MDLGLKGKNILITGSTSGVGQASAEIFAMEEANVIISGRNREKAEEIATDIQKKYGGKAIALPADLAESGAAENLFDRSVRAMGTLDVLINNAGIWPTTYVKDMEKDEFEKTIYMNLEVPYILSRLMVNHRDEQNS